MSKRILHLNLKKQWFDMIASGEKKEEYREVKDFWSRRLLSNNPAFSFKKYHVVIFKNGYQSNAPTLEIEFKEIKMKEGNPNWGAEPGELYYVILLGEIINSKLLDYGNS